MRLLNDKWYQILKWLALIAVNAFGLFYEGLATVWHLPYGEEVRKTCQLISVLIGALIGVSTAGYYMDQKKGEKKDE